MRIYSNSFELMSELGRELNSYGQTVKPKTYQNKVIEGKEEFETKELIDKLFHGSKINFFASFVSHEKLSEEERRQIKKMLEK